MEVKFKCYTSRKPGNLPFTYICVKATEKQAFKNYSTTKDRAQNKGWGEPSNKLELLDNVASGSNNRKERATKKEKTTNFRINKSINDIKSIYV